MKFLIAFQLFFILFFSNAQWSNDLQTAKETSQKEHKLILLNFSGSDWCAPCIMLKKEVFSSDEFKELAVEKLVLLRADFPRLKKNRLSDEDTRENEVLAEKYNPEGKFPLTLLLDADGSVIASWDGYNGKKDETLAKIKSAIYE
ncbi:thioredoxin family protein [Jiulongibacter sediminis]|uniref:Thiol-disulfide isomerase n=1 Tax=Jiulongibacter sediminis TaxID=1605367 RepID=A0A0P7BY61_9BACT|nr:thioredoxin family protein [Jiulongibacter sediminis]KPM49441.1 thiol-disulfide isomerase [Jiulongibacter sediminis]TBX26490.1 thiol-disulfide isomerase [Jiulongibacter sediminis]